ncbi:MAG TPA: diphosphomevalonate decarboxylase [Patescibacteria group bacterium]|nr:diphosphomevalonate decarboxylase [Patescibacteria group bacterium]
MKKTAIAPSNIAFIKYWGKKDEVLRLPENASIAMCLSNLLTTTTVEFDESLKEDEVTIDGEKDAKKSKRVSGHLDLIREIAKIKARATVVSKNNFPSGTGLSSSASGFAALTLAGVSAAGLDLSEKELSIIARKGSGSACRSIPSGFVEWQDADRDDMSFAYSIYPQDFWDIADVVVVVSNEKKYISTTEGHKSANANPFMKVRLERIGEKIKRIKKIMDEKNFKEFGELVEAEALELHSIMLTSDPPLLYWLPNTVLIMNFVRKLRESGLPVYFTINTGQDVHLIIEGKNVKKLISEIEKIEQVKNIIVNHPGQGTHLSLSHLF